MQLSTEEIVARLQDRRIDIVSSGSGVSRGTLRNVRKQIWKPSDETAKALSKYFLDQEKRFQAIRSA